MSDLELLKKYLQNEIDTGGNKIFVFDKDYNAIEFKTIDALNEINDLQSLLQQKENIIKEVREYIKSYESIETIQQFDHNKNNKDLDYSTIDEMTRRYMIVHDKILDILNKEGVN